MRYSNTLIASAALLSAGLTQAADLYVSGTGNDNNAGTLAAPYLTLNKAAGLVKPGDTVYVLDGKYDRVTLTVSGTSESTRITWKAYPGHHPEIFLPGWGDAIRVEASYQTIDGLTVTGNNDNVTLAGALADYYKEIPTFFVKNPATGANDIDPATGKPVTVDTPNPTYIPNYEHDGGYNGNGIDTVFKSFDPITGAAIGAHHLTVQNSIIRKFGCGGFGAGTADYIVFKDNKVYDNGWYSPYACSGGTIFNTNENVNDTNTGYHNYVTGNLFWNNRALVKWLAKGRYKDAQGVTRQADGALSDGNGFILDVNIKNTITKNADGSARTLLEIPFKGKTLIANNIAANNGGSGIHVFSASNADVFNNTLYLNGEVVNYADLFAAYAQNVRLFNNVVYVRPNGKINSSNNNTNVVYDYNVYYMSNGGASAAIAAGTQGSHDMIADPQFVNPGPDPRTADFHFKSTSPAIDSGITISGATPAADIEQISRPQGAGIDRGAYEYVVPSTPLVVPAGWTTAATTTTGAQIDAGGIASGVWTLSGRSNRIAGTADSLVSALQPWTGDVVVTAKVISGSSTLSAASAGITLRESAAVDARHVSTLVSPVRGVTYTRRLQAGGTTRSTAGSVQKSQVWVRLQRVGNVVSSFSSADGVTWTLVRRETVSLPTAVQVGLAVSSAGTATGNAVTFSNVSVSAQ